VIESVTSQFIPVKIHAKEQKELFDKFNVHWTPTQLILDSDGVERHRIEGFLPVEDFLAQLSLGLGKLHFQKGNYDQSERTLRDVVESHPSAACAAEARYWAGAVAYKKTHDAKNLGEAYKELQQSYPDSEWTKKASVWSH